MTGRRARVTLQPTVLRWARERAGLDRGQLAQRLGVESRVVSEWESSGKITLARADALARRTHTPVGHLYLAEPPDDSLPIKDFRVRGGTTPSRPSPNLLETVFQMQQRQLWMREELIHQEAAPLRFVGAFSPDSELQQVAAAMGDALRLRSGWAAAEGSWANALRTLRDCIESAGVLVVFNGVVGNDTHRKLDPDEFQGFALVDDYAPLVFVNNADYKTAQIFTLAHELAHIFVNQPGLSKLEDLHWTGDRTEESCNHMAAEFLVPESELTQRWPSAKKTADPFRDLARHFKVSTVVAARRALDCRLITRSVFFEYYEANKARDASRTSQDEPRRGGDFWRNQHWRLGARLGAAVSRAVREGRLSYREAYSLTGLKGDTFAKMPEEMGFVL